MRTTNLIIETFFLPKEISRTNWSTPADIYNLYRSLLIRNKSNPVFVPIRSMQFMAILDRHEIIFVDSQSYAVSDDIGGRMILLAWQFDRLKQRDSLDQQVPCEVVSYELDNRELQMRLVSEFRQSMELLDQRYRESFSEQNQINIVRL